MFLATAATLLAPALEMLAHMAGRHVVVVPQRHLNTVSMAALPMGDRRLIDVLASISTVPKGGCCFAGVAVVGAVLGVVAGFLFGDRIAGAVMGVVLGVFGARGRALVDRGAEVRSALPDQVLGGTAL